MNTFDDNFCTELWHECEPQLRKLCQAKLQKYPNEIDDVIAETFLILCDKTKKSGLPENPKAWLYGVFGNILNAKYREIYKEKDSIIDISNKKYKLPFVQSFEKEMFDRISHDELISRLDTELNDEEKLIIKLHYADGIKLRVIAKRLGSTEAAIKQRIFRLRMKIKKIAKEIDYYN